MGVRWREEVAGGLDTRGWRLGSWGVVAMERGEFKIVEICWLGGSDSCPWCKILWLRLGLPEVCSTAKWLIVSVCRTYFRSNAYTQ